MRNYGLHSSKRNESEVTSIITNSSLYNYSGPVFIGTQGIHDYISFQEQDKKIKKDLYPTGQWWKVLLFIRNCLAHNVQYSRNELTQIIGQSMRNIYMLFGVDLSEKTAFKSITENDCICYYYSNDEQKNPTYIPLLSYSTDITEIFKNLTSVNFQSLKDEFEKDYQQHKEIVSIFEKSLKALIVSKDKKLWSKSFNRRVEELKSLS